MAIGMTLTLMVGVTTVHAEGRLSGILGGGLDAARSVGSRVANRGTQAGGLAGRVLNRGADATRAIGQRGTGVVSNATTRGLDTGSQVATRSLNVAGSAINGTVSAGVAVGGRIVDVGTNVTTRGVTAVGSAGNSVRIAVTNVQPRIENLSQQVVAAGVERFSNATRVLDAAPVVGQNLAAQNLVNPVAEPGLVGVPGVVDGALQVGNGLANGNAVQVADGIVNIVDASQPQLPAGVIPAAVGALGAINGRAGGDNSIVAGDGNGVPTTSSANDSSAAVSILETGTSSTTAEADAAVDIENNGFDSQAESNSIQDGAPDLVLEDLQLSAAATIVAGPAYVLRFRNQGSAVAQGFHVALLAGVNGQVTADAPRAMGYLSSVDPGQTVVINLRLPVSATQIRGVDGSLVPMTDVFVSLDFADVVEELDENNNLAIVQAKALQTNTK